MAIIIEAKELTFDSWSPDTKMTDIVKVTFNETGAFNADMSDDDDAVDAILVDEVNQVNR